MLVGSGVVYYVGMELIEYVLHAFAIAHIADNGDETAVGELCFQVHQEVVQG